MPKIANVVHKTAVDLDEEGNVRNPDEAQLQQIREQTVQLFGHGLQRLAEEQVSLKQELEERWIDDLRHYNGKYDRMTESQMNTDKEKSGRTSTIFVNLTRAKTNLAEAKLSDTILPTDDKNWGISPTPVPELADMEQDERPVMMANGQPAQKPNGEGHYTYAELSREARNKAEKACTGMEREIDDQLTEAKFNAVCRDVIHSACVLGTGIIKGPVITKRMNKQWRQMPAQDGSSMVYQMILDMTYKPDVMWVDPWNYFPDMSATSFSDVEFHFERHLLTKKKVRKLALRPGFDRDAIRELLRQDPRSNRTSMEWLSEIRQINGITQIHTDRRYEVWEYHGPVKKSDLLACGCGGIDIDDPMEEYEGIVWFAHGIVLKVGLSMMDDDAAPYNVFNWEADESSVFGFGVPYRMRSAQKVMNGSWRMLLDNAGLSTGPQIVINRRVVEPEDGIWELTPRKIWFLKNEKYKINDAFGTFEISSHQEELSAIFEMAHTLAEQETNLPQIGSQMDQENQPAVMKTLGGTALWMSSNNITLRSAVKNWDDEITVPLLTRWYDWNMQFNPKNEIKGDFQVDARGSSVLLVREMQARSMADFVSIAMNLPGGPDYLKVREILEESGKSLQLSVDTIMMSDEEMQQKAEEQQGQQQPDPETMKAQMQMQIAQANLQERQQAAQMSLQEKQIEAEAMIQSRLIDREIQYAKMAQDRDVKVGQLMKDYELDQIHVNWDREKFYQELAIKQRKGIEANYGLGE